MSENVEVLKPSIFNVFGKIKDKNILANTFSGAILEVGDAEKTGVELLFSNPSFVQKYQNQYEIVDKLVKNGFFIDQNRDEKEELKKLFDIAKKGDKALGILITTSRQCNFRCTYCYESFANEYFRYDETEKIFKYLKTNVNGRESLKVTWWGGEPLLAVDFIKNVSYKLIDFAKSHNLKYSAVMPTNAYLLKREVAEVLKDCCISTLQITIDGEKDYHNKRRVHVNGDETGTFDTIVKNVIENAELFDSIVLRINADKRNADGIYSLLKTLLPVKEKIIFALRPTIEHHDINSPPWMLSDEEFFNLRFDFVLKAKELGYQISIGHIRPGTSFCSIYQSNNTIGVEPNGDVQVCPIFTGNHKERFGFLNNAGILEHNEAGKQYKTGVGSSPFDDEECHKCKALPICMGGCPLAVNRSYRCMSKNKIAELMYLCEKVHE